MKSKFEIIFILFLTIGNIFSSQVKNTMENIVTETALVDLYQYSDNYSRRYILKYLPEWMENRSISGPSSFSSIIEDAVLADNCYLVEEAIILVGKYQLENSFTEMDVLYKDIMSKFPNYAHYIRMAILTALLGSADEVRNEYITRFLDYRPTSFLQSEFSSLVYAASQYCDLTVVPRLNDYKTEILSDAAELAQSNPEKYGIYKEQFDKIVKELDKAIISINERGE